MWHCEVCGTKIEDYELTMCCDGYMCGCYGRPIEPIACIEECLKQLGWEVKHEK